MRRQTRGATGGRGGLTMIELLVVIATIAILVGILLPAIQQAREGARRTQCQNNLRQLSLAVLAYESGHGVLPPGCIGTYSPVTLDPSEPHFGWLTQIIPQLDDGPFYDRFDFESTAYENTSDWMLTAFQTKPRTDVTTCPSVWGNYENEPSNYVGLHNGTFGPITDSDDGLLFLNSSVRREDVPDGYSSTLLIAETVAPAPVNWAFGTRATLRSPEFDAEPLGFGAAASRRGYTIEIPDPLDVGPENEGVVLTFPPAFDTYEDALRSQSVGSEHLGGFNVATAAGVVRYIGCSTDPGLLRDLVRRSDGRPLEGF